MYALFECLTQTEFDVDLIAEHIEELYESKNYEFSTLFKMPSVEKN